MSNEPAQPVDQGTAPLMQEVFGGSHWGKIVGSENMDSPYSRYVLSGDTTSGKATSLGTMQGQADVAAAGDAVTQAWRRATEEVYIALRTALDGTGAAQALHEELVRADINGFGFEGPELPVDDVASSKAAEDGSPLAQAAEPRLQSNVTGTAGFSITARGREKIRRSAALEALIASVPSPKVSAVEGDGEEGSGDAHL